MGLLQLGTPLDWPEAKKAADQVRNWGIEQLLTIWRKARGKERDALLWGDEIEYLLIEFDDPAQKVRLTLSQTGLLEALASNDKLAQKGCVVPDLQDIEPGSVPTFHPEFGRFMLESTPGKPWTIGFKDLLAVEADMKLRRVLAKEHMSSSQFPITLTTFPRLGTKDDYITPYYPPSGSKLRSQFVPDEITNPHIRFPTLAANIRSRRGRKVELNVPVYKDTQTPTPFKDPTVDYDMHNWPEDADVRNGAAKDDHVYMDSMAFGMGSCCLQITFQSKNITEGRTLYDQLSPLGPIMLALTAATPIYKGFLVDTDVRWNQISGSVDDRTREELGEAPLQHDRWRIPKSRYASNSTYIAQDERLRPEYMDPNLIVDEKLKSKLVAGGMDDRLATHFAHLFIRDPIVIFAEDLKTLDPEGSNHFENIQSTNWQHMRFKPPPPDADIGWRVEFRSMEIAMTDFENAAFAIFIVLITRAILSFDLNFYIPIPRTTENMKTAHGRDAVLNSKFWFRKDVFPTRTPRHSPKLSPHLFGNSRFENASGISTPASTGFQPTVEILTEDQNAEAAVAAETQNDTSTQTQAQAQAQVQAPSNTDSTSLPPVESEYTQMSIAEIINGTLSLPTSANGTSNQNPNQENDFPGLIPLVENYLSSIPSLSVSTRCEIERYLSLIRKRANGTLWTNAKWIRHFVRTHPTYAHDSVVNQEITYDLCKEVVEITKNEGRDGKGSQMFNVNPS